MGGFRWCCLQSGLPIYLVCRQRAAQLHNWADALWQPQAVSISIPPTYWEIAADSL